MGVARSLCRRLRLFRRTENTRRADPCYRPRQRDRAAQPLPSRRSSSHRRNVGFPVQSNPSWGWTVELRPAHCVPNSPFSGLAAGKEEVWREGIVAMARGRAWEFFSREETRISWRLRPFAPMAWLGVVEVCPALAVGSLAERQPRVLHAASDRRARFFLVPRDLHRRKPNAGAARCSYATWTRGATGALPAVSRRCVSNLRWAGVPS